MEDKPAVNEISRPQATQNSSADWSNYDEETLDAEILPRMAAAHRFDSTRIFPTPQQQNGPRIGARTQAQIDAANLEAWDFDSYEQITPQLGLGYAPPIRGGVLPQEVVGSPTPQPQGQTTTIQPAVAHVARRLRGAIGVDVQQISEDLYAEVVNNTAEEDRQEIEHDERTVAALRREMRRLVEERVLQLGIQQRPAIITGSQFGVHSRLFRPSAHSADTVFGRNPDSPPTADSARRSSFGFLHPSPASVARIIPHIEPLSIAIAPESISVHQHVDRAATPPIRSAAPSPPALTSHVRGRHSPES